MRLANKLGSFQHVKKNPTLPLPSVVLGIEQEVSADDGNADRDDGKDQKHQKHEPVDIVDFVCPEGSKDEVPEVEKTVQGESNGRKCR